MSPEVAKRSSFGRGTLYRYLWLNAQHHGLLRSTVPGTYMYVPFLGIPIKPNPKIMYFAPYFACNMQIAMALACRCISRVVIALSPFKSQL